MFAAAGEPTDERQEDKEALAAFDLPGRMVVARVTPAVFIEILE
jgi:hypothetical protein